MKTTEQFTWNPLHKFVWRVWQFILHIPEKVAKGFKALGGILLQFICSVRDAVVNFGRMFVDGDIWTKLSYLIMGIGCAAHKQIVKGLLYLGVQVGAVWYMISFGWQYLKHITTLGTATKYQVWDEAAQIYRYVQGDNSMLILLYSVMSIILLLVALGLYFSNIKASYKAELCIREGKKPSTIIEDCKALLDQKFHVTLLTVPTVSAFAFVILPIIFMVLIAFTNYDKNHQPPGNLFTWVGFENFANMIWNDPVKSKTFSSLTGWTFIWAFFATFTNYIFGMLLAIMINKQGIKLKKLWRTIFVTTIAVPQFVSLLLMSKLLGDQGSVNVLLQQIGWIDEPIQFLTNGTIAKVTVIIVNMWVGIPYTMLTTTGILMNIPKELYESARIDGAGPFKTFTRITLPYMLFVTTPYLITQFIGNFNNFNVIYLLTQGNPLSLDYYQAGQTDLLVTWLYKLTVNQQDYNFASTIGIMVFIVSAVFALISYNISPSAKREEEFQ